jgi:hypothetical protein
VSTESPIDSLTSKFMPWFNAYGDCPVVSTEIEDASNALAEFDQIWSGLTETEKTASENCDLLDLRRQVELRLEYGEDADKYHYEEKYGEEAGW